MTVRSITRSRDDITRSLLVLLVCMENIFKELFLFTISRGVPLDCGCKGRYFSITDQILLQLFFKKMKRKIISVWLTLFEKVYSFQDLFKKCNPHITKPEIMTSYSHRLHIDIIITFSLLFTICNSFLSLSHTKSLLLQRITSYIRKSYEQTLAPPLSLIPYNRNNYYC